MPAKIFISCGQASEEETVTAKDLKQSLLDMGFEAYVAKEEHHLNDLNDSVISELESSDYFLFIDFYRQNASEGYYTRSLFAHQELALAHYLGFRNIIPLQQFRNGQDKLHFEGFLGFDLGNPTSFRDHSEINEIVGKQIEEQGWHKGFSRQLVAKALSNPLVFPYADHAGEYREDYTWHMQIMNGRQRQSARNVLAVLQSISMNNEVFASPDKSPIKWAEQHYSAAVIPPLGEAKFDAFSITASEPHLIYLHSMLDMPRHSIISEPGTYELTYLVDAEGYPPLRLKIKVQLTEDIPNNTTATLVASEGASSQSPEELPAFPQRLLPCGIQQRRPTRNGECPTTVPSGGSPGY